MLPKHLAKLIDTPEKKLRAENIMAEGRAKAIKDAGFKTEKQFLKHIRRR